MSSDSRKGQIITFYSYKGGTGRTMALVNVACLLRRRIASNGRILLIDWDLEAPGLRRFFESLPNSTYGENRTGTTASGPGLVELMGGIQEFLTMRKQDPRESLFDHLDSLYFDHYITPLPLTNLYLLGAGVVDEQYSSKVARLDWESMYHYDPTVFTEFADYLMTKFDYVLIDSRTGVVDVSGICTALMPEQLVAVFTPNRQSLDGVLRVVREAASFRKQSQDPRPLRILPLVSRVDLSEEKLREKWRFGSSAEAIVGYQHMWELLFADIYDLDECNLAKYFDELQVQHVPAYAYGEKIAVLEEAAQDRLSLTRSYEQLVNWLLISELPGVVVQEKSLRTILKESTLTGYLADSVQDSKFRSLGIDIDAKFSEEEGLNRLVDLAERLHRAQESTGAEACYRSALRLSELSSGTTSELRLRALNGLAIQHTTLGRHAEAEPLYLQALALRERLSGPNDLETANALDNLASLYYDMGRYSEAQQLYQKALDITEATLGPVHADVATRLNNLAVSYYNEDRYAEAESLYLRALEIDEQVLGPNHPSLTVDLNNLALLYVDIRDFVKAEVFCQRMVEIDEKALGPNHPDFASDLSKLAVIKSHLLKFDEAVQLLLRSIEIGEKQLGSDHPDVAKSLNDLGLLYSRQGKYDIAEPLYLRALAIGEKQLGSEHSDVAACLNNLGSLYSHQGKYDKAEPLYLRALAISEKQLGSDHPDVATWLNNIGLLYSRQGKYDKAEPLYLRALTISEKQLGLDHPDVATWLNNIGLLYSRQGKYDKAEPLYLRALTISEKQLGSDHPDVAKSLNNLGLLYSNQGKYDKAEPFLLRALDIFVSSLGERHLNTISLLDSLEQFYRAWGKEKEAEKYAARLKAAKQEPGD